MNSAQFNKLISNNFHLALNANQNHDEDEFKRKCSNLVVLTRLEARNYVNEHKAAKAKLQQTLRAVRKAEDGGVSCLFTGKWISDLYKKVEAAQETLYRYGMTTAVILDQWQIAGATLEDLCNLCDKSFTVLKSELSPSEYTDRFSTLVAAHDIDATLTYLFREMLSYVMAHTKEGQDVGKNGTDLRFPGLMSNTLYLLGRQYMLDNDDLSTMDFFGNEDFS